MKRGSRGPPGKKELTESWVGDCCLLRNWIYPVRSESLQIEHRTSTRSIVVERSSLDDASGYCFFLRRRIAIVRHMLTRHHPFLHVEGMGGLGDGPLVRSVSNLTEDEGLP